MAKSKAEIIQAMRAVAEDAPSLTQTAVAETPDATNEAAVSNDAVETPTIEAAPPIVAEAPQATPTESERYHQSRADKLQALVEKQAQQVEALTTQLMSIQDRMIQAQQPQTPPQEDLSEYAQDPRLRQYLQTVTAETLKKDLQYDPSLQDKVKLFFDVQEFRAQRPDSVNYNPIFEQAFNYLPIPKTKEGFEKVYDFITKGLVPLAQSLAGAGKAEGVKVAPKNQGTRTISAEAAQAAAAKLRSSNEEGVALTNSVPRPKPSNRKEFIKGVLEKNQMV